MIFADAGDAEEIGFASCWRREKSLADSEAQCEPVAHAENAAQTDAGVDEGTSPEEPPLAELPSLDAPIAALPGIGPFLARAAESVFAALAESGVSHAFDAWDSSISGEDGGSCSEPSLFAELQKGTASHGRALEEDDTPAPEAEAVTALDWNATGSVLAVAHGALSHEGWCGHRSYVVVWGVFRGPRAGRASAASVDLGSCATALSFHPSRPSLLAIGEFTGQLVVVDVERAQQAEETGVSSAVVASTDLHADDAHRDAVTAVSWSSSSSSSSSSTTSLELATAGADGKVIVWTLQQTLGSAPSLRPLRTIPVGAAAAGPTVPGVTSFAWLSTESPQFVAGTEGGRVFKVSADAAGGAVAAAMGAATVAYESHSGPVQAIVASPFHRNVFASASSDGTMRLYNALQTRSLLSFTPSEAAPLCAQWSPSRPCVLASGSADGRLHFMDFAAPLGQVKPAVSVRAGGKDDSAVTSLSFNRVLRGHIATGHVDGTVRVWELPQALAQRSPADMPALERFGDISRAKKRAHKH